MPKLRIEVKRNIEMIEEVFKQMGQKGIFRGLEVKMYSAMFKSKSHGLYMLMRRKLARYIVKETKHKFIVEDQGDITYVQQQKRKFENFMYAGEEAINKEKEYQAAKNQRFISKVMRFMNRGYTKTKDKAISSALGGSNVLGFFSRCGISIIWDIVN